MNAGEREESRPFIFTGSLIPSSMLAARTCVRVDVILLVACARSFAVPARRFENDDALVANCVVCTRPRASILLDFVWRFRVRAPRSERAACVEMCGSVCRLASEECRFRSISGDAAAEKFGIVLIQ